MTKLIPIKYECCKLFYNPDTKKISAVVTVNDSEENMYSYYDLAERDFPENAKEKLLSAVLHFVNNHIAHIDLLTAQTRKMLGEALQKTINDILEIKE